MRHLVALPVQDRYLRFGYAATDEQIGRYVAGLNFERDEIFGVFMWRPKGFYSFCTHCVTNAPFGFCRL